MAGFQIEKTLQDFHIDSDMRCKVYRKGHNPPSEAQSFPSPWSSLSCLRYCWQFVLFNGVCNRVAPQDSFHGTAISLVQHPTAEEPGVGRTPLTSPSHHFRDLEEVGFWSSLTIERQRQGREKDSFYPYQNRIDLYKHFLTPRRLAQQKKKDLLTGHQCYIFGTRTIFIRAVQNILCSVLKWGSNLYFDFIQRFFSFFLRYLQCSNRFQFSRNVFTLMTENEKLICRISNLSLLEEGRKKKKKGKK